MKMKYTLISECAVEEIISNSFLQSVEFELGNSLLLKLNGTIAEAKLPPNLIFTNLKDGLAVTTNRYTLRSKGIVIDNEQSNFFAQKDAQCLFVLQKVLRLAKKLWENLSLNYSERLLSTTTKAALFPLGEYRPIPFRVMIERNPMAERLKKRGLSNQFLLVYKSGYDPKKHSETVSETNFKKVIEQLSAITENVNSVASSMPDSNFSNTDALAVSNLTRRDTFDSTSIYRAYDDWLPILTSNQKRFIEQDVSGAHRIEGAAGTGKTLCLMLKAINQLRKAKAESREFHIVFVTHSQPTKRSIMDFLNVIDQDGFSALDRQLEPRTLKVRTLSEICAEQLKQQVSETEFVDEDAYESKGLQRVYINDAFDEVMEQDYIAHKTFLSVGLKDFLKSTEPWKVAEMLQHEISVLIKGRAADNLDVYKKIPPLKYGIPVRSEADKGFIYTIFRSYQMKLNSAAQFDTDDVVLTTINHLDTPIWRRRRKRDGFDAVFIDETHLFNINELHMFHFFTRELGPYPIVYSVDRSQAVGDHGWTTEEIASSLMTGEGSVTLQESSKLKTIFRSSPQIINLAFAVVSSGATLFDNFDNPMDSSSSSFTAEEEKLSRIPTYRTYPHDEALVQAAFNRADKIQKELSCKKGQILIVYFDKVLGKTLTDYASGKNKPHIVLEKRGDLNAVEKAEKAGKVVIGYADFVGGLEFAAVICVGIDDGRLPPMSKDESSSSRNFQLYSSHNRLYVAVTRAKFRVELLGEKSRGPSTVIGPSIASGVIEVIESQ